MYKDGRLRSIAETTVFLGIMRALIAVNTANYFKEK